MRLGELAPAILATIQTASKLIDVIIVHMGNDRDDLDRKLQAEKLRDIMQNRFVSFLSKISINRFTVLLIVLIH
jgi:hypothetical protein